MVLTKDGGLMQSRGRDRNPVPAPLPLGQRFPNLDVPVNPAEMLLKCTFACSRLPWDSVFQRGSWVMPGFFLVQGPHLE